MIKVLQSGSTVRCLGMSCGRLARAPALLSAPAVINTRDPLPYRSLACVHWLGCQSALGSVFRSSRACRPGPCSAYLAFALVHPRRPLQSTTLYQATSRVVSHLVFAQLNFVRLEVVAFISQRTCSVVYAAAPVACMSGSPCHWGNAQNALLVNEVGSPSLCTHHSRSRAAISSCTPSA